MNQLGENIARYRKEKGLSQEDVLLGDKGKSELDETNISTNKASVFLIGISILCIIAYVVISSMLHIFDVGTLIIMFVICVPIQLFLHIYFSNAIRMNSFSGLAGYDQKIEYNDEDKKRAIKSIPLTVVYITLVLIGMILITGVFEIKGIENNTMPALRLAGMYIFGTLIVTIGFCLENNNIKKWNPNKTQYRINKISIGSVFACLIVYGLMCIL